MVKHSRRFIAIFLSLPIMLSLTACFGQNNGNLLSNGSSGLNPANTSGAMGRYVEKEEFLPEGILVIDTMAQLPDGSIRILGDVGGRGIGPWLVLSSKDGGHSWENVDYPWLEDLNGCQILSAAIAHDGVYIAHTANLLDGADGMEEIISDEDTPANPESSGDNSANEEGEDSAIAYMNPDYTFVFGDANGLTEVPYKPVPEHDTIMTITLYAADNGDLISVGSTGQILQIDTKAWREKNVYQVPPVVGLKPGVAAYNNTLAIHSSDKITLYDLESGSAQGDIPTTGTTQASRINQKNSVISIPPNGSAYYYSNDTGLYRVPMDTSVSERLVDGGLSSLSTQTLSFQSIFSVGGDEYLALATTPEFESKLFRYTYNPDIPTEPSQVLKVYSLYNNKTIRQAISGFQLKYPDIRVSYQVGIDGGGSVTAADAMRSLSTELLAGKGPDVMVLDDMPIDSYIQKNVLYDISELLPAGEYSSNIAKAYERDGKIYAIPARFSIPVLLGNDIGNVNNLNDFVSWLGTQYTYDIGIKPENIMSRFYSSVSYRWFTDDGTLNQEAFRNDLEQLGTLASKIREVGEIHSIDDTIIETLLWYGGAISAYYATINGYIDVMLFEAAIKNRPTSSYSPFPNDAGGTFIPGTVMGVNSSTTEKENAKNFISHTLSNEVQATELGDGFPVNVAALEQLSINPEGVENPESLVVSIVVNDARTGELIQVELSSAWPSDEFMTAFKNTLKNVQVPVKVNAVIREMVIDETKGYIGGTRSLDDTVRSFSEKMAIYLAEQA